jgi:hypothetical protein
MPRTNSGSSANGHGILMDETLETFARGAIG